MTTFVLIAVSIVRQWEGALLGLTAHERFNAMRRLNNSENFMKSEWWTTTMLIVLACSIIALVAVNLYRKIRESARRKTEDRGQIAGTLQSSSDIENRVSNIEQRVLAVEHRLTNVEQEVASFEIVEDDAPCRDGANMVSAAADTKEEPK